MYSQKNDDFSCFMLQETEEIADDSKVQLPSTVESKEMTVSGVWKLYFDGAYSRDGSGAGTLLISPKGHFIPFSYKLEFDSTNNIIEYEALILGVQAAKCLGI